MDRIPFPQADNIERIIKIFDIAEEKNLTDFTFVGAYLDGITDRQVSYYLSAAMYLGLLTKSKKYTEIGAAFKEMDKYSRITELIRILLSDPIIGKIYISQKVLGVTYDIYDVADFIAEYYPDYTEQIYKRRSQTVLSWLSWIDSYLYNKQ